MVTRMQHTSGEVHFGGKPTQRAKERKAKMEEWVQGILREIL